MKRSRKSNFVLIPSQCERCGTSLYTLNRSLFGQDKLKKEFGVICQDCVDKAALDALPHLQLDGIMEKFKQGNT